MHQPVQWNPKNRALSTQQDPPCCGLEMNLFFLAWKRNFQEKTTVFYSIPQKSQFFFVEETGGCMNFEVFLFALCHIKASPISSTRRGSSVFSCTGSFATNKKYQRNKDSDWIQQNVGHFSFLPMVTTIVCSIFFAGITLKKMTPLRTVLPAHRTLGPWCVGRVKGSQGGWKVFFFRSSSEKTACDAEKWDSGNASDHRSTSKFFDDLSTCTSFEICLLFIFAMRESGMQTPQQEGLLFSAIRGLFLWPKVISYFLGKADIQSHQIMATSAEVTPNDGEK